MAKFTLFSYEFRGVESSLEPTLFPLFSHDEIQKNFSKRQELFDLFFEENTFPEYFDFKGKQHFLKLLWKYNGIIVFQMDRRGWTNQALNFKNNKIPNNPWIDIIIDNRKERQLIAVKKNTNAFKYNNTIAQILQENFSKWLTKNYGLEVSVKAQYESKVFWKLYKKFYEKHGIQRIQFNFPFPNKDWMTENIKSLQLFGKERNGAVRLGIEAAKGEGVYFEENEGNKMLVNTCSGTGADIILKPVNHKIIHITKEMNPVEQHMPDETLKTITNLKEEDNAIFGDGFLKLYNKTSEFLNNCKQYYA